MHATYALVHWCNGASVSGACIFVSRQHNVALGLTLGSLMAAHVPRSSSSSSSSLNRNQRLSHDFVVPHVAQTVFVFNAGPKGGHSKLSSQEERLEGAAGQQLQYWH